MAIRRALMLLNAILLPLCFSAPTSENVRRQDIPAEDQFKGIDFSYALQECSSDQYNILTETTSSALNYMSLPFSKDSNGNDVINAANGAWHHYFGTGAAFDLGWHGKLLILYHTTGNNQKLTIYSISKIPLLKTPPGALSVRRPLRVIFREFG